MFSWVAFPGNPTEATTSVGMSPLATWPKECQPHWFLPVAPVEGRIAAAMAGQTGPRGQGAKGPWDGTRPLFRVEANGIGDLGALEGLFGVASDNKGPPKWMFSVFVLVSSPEIASQQWFPPKRHPVW